MQRMFGEIDRHRDVHSREQEQLESQDIALSEALERARTTKGMRVPSRRPPLAGNKGRRWP